jgi:cadherin-like protein 24
VGRLKAQDPDLGDNALVAYSILNGEGSEVFSISTDSQGQDGLLTVRKVSFLPATCRCSCGYEAHW